MGLRGCDDCGHLITTDNAVCPGCGKSHPAIDAGHSSLERIDSAVANLSEVTGSSPVPAPRGEPGASPPPLDPTALGGDASLPAGGDAAVSWSGIAKAGAEASGAVRLTAAPEESRPQPLALDTPSGRAWPKPSAPPPLDMPASRSGLIILPSEPVFRSPPPIVSNEVSRREVAAAPPPVEAPPMPSSAVPAPSPPSRAEPGSGFGKRVAAPIAVALVAVAAAGWIGYRALSARIGEYEERSTACVVRSQHCQWDCDHARGASGLLVPADPACSPACLRTLGACLAAPPDRQPEEVSEKRALATLADPRLVEVWRPTAAPREEEAMRPKRPDDPPSAAPRGDGSEQAIAHFRRGSTAFESGDYTTAIEEFREANELHPTPILDYNIGLAFEKTGKGQLAIRYYKRYLKSNPDIHAEVEAKIANLVE